MRGYRQMKEMTMSKKSYGQIAFENTTMSPVIDDRWKDCGDDARKAYERGATAVIAEYERRNKIAELRAYTRRKEISVETIYEMLRRGIGKSYMDHFEIAVAIHAMVYGEQVETKPDDAQRGFLEPIEDVEEKKTKPETEDQYQSRLLRALRDFG